ncbi:MAG: hypothetical protein M3515_11450 [Actinomycetota bacterium]|jgi:hypothetical protein|nr:hypothetical protein [Actinomycetota bacterium]
MEGFDRSPSGELGEDQQDDSELSLEELEAQAAGTLPDRQAMSLIDANVTIPASPSLAADVLADTLEDALTDEDPGGSE